MHGVSDGGLAVVLPGDAVVDGFIVRLDLLIPAGEKVGEVAQIDGEGGEFYDFGRGVLLFFDGFYIFGNRGFQDDEARLEFLPVCIK